MSNIRRHHVALAGLLVALLVSGAVPASHARTQHAMPSTKAPVVRVVAHDYAFESLDTVAAGPVTFEFENRGQHFHELIVGLLKPGVTATDIVAAHQRGMTLRQLPEAYLAEGVNGALLAKPGERSGAQLVMPLARGKTYVLLCQLRDSLGKPQHAVLGMFRMIHVR